MRKSAKSVGILAATVILGITLALVGYGTNASATLASTQQATIPAQNGAATAQSTSGSTSPNHTAQGDTPLNHVNHATPGNTAPHPSTAVDTPQNHFGATVQLEPIPTLNMQPIKYTPAQLTEVQNTAKAVGIQAFLPQIGTTGDQLSVVKNGETSLILDYKNIWIVESAEPIPLPRSVATDNKPYIPSTTITTSEWLYVTTNFGSNSLLYLRKGRTYICIQNLCGSLTKWQLMSISSSLQ
ncbi:hypothetical protein CEB3_c51040 [Peptococcaceae bacterium CEB3]|nr:hypothetical protein CEB3_c51040 [Peptococcaceae bacterium CEB3]